MPYNPDDNSYSRALRFVDDREVGDEVTRSDLDAVLDDLASGVNAALNQVINFVGDWNAASGVFPTTRPDGSAIRRRDAWRVSAPGATGGVVFEENETLLALVTAPATTYSRNWLRLPAVASSIVNTILAEVQALADDVAETADVVAATAADVEADRAATEAAAAVIPAATGQAGKMIRVKADESGYETRTPAQVLTDIGMPSPSGNGAKMVRINGTGTAYELRTQAQVRSDIGLGDLATKSVSDGAAAIIGFTPVEQGGGTDMGSNKVRLGWRTDATGIQAQVDASVIGVLAMKADITSAIAAYNPSTSRVLAATAGASLGAVGSYAMLGEVASSSMPARNPGDLIAGSALRYATSAGLSGTSPPGTWRLMGGAYSVSPGSNGPGILWLRVS